MILFQITLSGSMLRTLAVAHAQERTGEAGFFDAVGSNFITAVRSLERQGLITHENHIGRPREGEAPTFATPGRRFHYEITEKGRYALQLAACDLQDFLDQVKIIPPAAPPKKRLYPTQGAS